MSPDRDQAISFAYGNLKIDRPDLKREDVERAYDQLQCYSLNNTLLKLDAELPGDTSTKRLARAAVTENAARGGFISLKEEMDWNHFTLEDVPNFRRRATQAKADARKLDCMADILEHSKDPWIMRCVSPSASTSLIGWFVTADEAVTAIRQRRYCTDRVYLIRNIITDELVVA